MAALDGKPLILVTNDDGCSALGLAVLARHLGALADVIVAAPSQEQSAVGHGITLSRPLRVTSLRPGWFAVSGTPADSVLLATSQLCPRKPSLVVSGINHGLNLGTDVFYSGTLAGALEGVLRDIQAIAVSQELPEDLPVVSPGQRLEDLLERTAAFAAQVAGRLLDSAPLPAGTFLSINAPAADSRSYCWTKLGRRVYREQVEKRLDLRGRPYYWIGGPALRNVSPPGTDAHAVDAGLISVTPVGLDLTADLSGWYHRCEVGGFDAVEPLDIRDLAEARGRHD